MINSLLNILSPHRKRCYLFSEGSANDKKLLGIYFITSNANLSTNSRILTHTAGLKGSHLCEIFRLKLSGIQYPHLDNYHSLTHSSSKVPPGFIITSECMEEFKNHYQNLTVLPKELLSEIETKIRELEKIIGKI